MEAGAALPLLGTRPDLRRTREAADGIVVLTRLSRAAMKPHRVWWVTSRQIGKQQQDRERDCARLSRRCSEAWGELESIVRDIFVHG